MRRKLDNIRGAGVVNTPDSLSINCVPASTSGSDSTPNILYARLTAQNSTNKWIWSWQQVVLQEDYSWDDGDLSGTFGGSDPKPAFEINGWEFDGVGEIV